jgi:hypothetical protein
MAATPNIIGPDIKIIDNNIIVKLSISDEKELETTIKSGIEQEIVFTVELLRVWKFWPDEFVVSKKIKKNVKYDNLREQYKVSSYDGINRIKEYFKDYNSMKNWIFNVDSINLANIKELEPGSYYIRIVIESKSNEHIPIIGFLIHFIPEVEMSLAKESQPFIIEDN